MLEPPLAAVPVPLPPADDDELVPAELDELDEPPQAAMDAARPAAAAPVPIFRPAIFRNFSRSTSSRASRSTAPSRARSPALMRSVIGSPFESSRLPASGYKGSLRTPGRAGSLIHSRCGSASRYAMATRRSKIPIALAATALSLGIASCGSAASTKRSSRGHPALRHLGCRSRRGFAAKHGGADTPAVDDVAIGQ